ncbi:unnamed protein product [Adineta ricciae]|uniref:Uncharacterized protein n=1 Tax=Adineta ricciae TaxID=249248 RepID=A0A815V7U8_ADIRI|nr:unnamed protein product [Adineta ricciae]
MLNIKSFCLRWASACLEFLKTILMVPLSTFHHRSSESSIKTGSYALSLEGKKRCNLKTPEPCFGTNKSLVITFGEGKSGQRWLALNLLNVFPEQYFDYIVMVHDNSSWNHYSGYDKIVWIHVRGQFRFWYVKRFAPPHILRAYRYIWIIDDDARFHFNTRAYECVVEKYNVLLSSPGRWTDFVEIGPLVIGKAWIWTCLWDYLSEKNSLGYGLDNIWCGVINTCFRETLPSRACAILDIFVVHHDSERINNAQIGLAEMPAYEKPYKLYWAKMQEFGPIAVDLAHVNICNSKVSQAYTRK